MSNSDNIKNRIINHQRRLQKLKEKQALRGLDTPVDVSIEIEDIEVELRELQMQLPDIEDEDNPIQVYHNLPQPDYQKFIGREEELAKIHKFLLEQHGVIIIYGSGGIGKSSLALEVAYHYLNTHELFKAIIWSSARQTTLKPERIIPRKHVLSTLEDLYETISVTLRRQDINIARPEQQYERALQALTRQRTLLIIDNLETVDNDDILSFLLDLPISTNAIVTTRHRVDGNCQIQLKAMSKQNAKHLIDQICQEKEVKVVRKRELQDYTQGIPLAIIWSIAQIKIGYSIDRILKRLTSSQDDIAKFCFDGSLERIRDTDAHKLLIALALFETDVSCEALGEVAGLPGDGEDCEKELQQLVRFSLINRKQNDRYMMTSLTKEYVLGEFKKYPEKINEWRRRQLQYYLEKVLTPYYIVHVDFVSGVVETQIHSIEIENLQLLFEWCQTTLDKDGIYLNFADGYSTLLYLLGQVNRAIEVAKWGLELAQKLKDSFKQYDFRNKLILYYTWSDRFEDANANLKEAHFLSRQHPNYRPDNVIEYHGAYFLRKKQLLEACKPICLSTKIREDYAYSDKIEQHKVAVLGRFMVGVLCYRSAIKLRELKDEKDLDRAKTLWTELKTWLGTLDATIVRNFEDQNFDEMIILAIGATWLQKGLSLAEELNFERGKSYILNYLGNIYIEQKEFAEAEKSLITSRKIAKKLKDQRRIARGQQSLIRLYKVQGYDKWQDLVQSTKEMFEKLGMSIEMEELE